MTGEENDTDETNASGLPPHSIELVVYGGLDEEIAKAIHRRKGAGIQTYGNVTVPVVDAAGNIKNISFSRPAPTTPSRWTASSKSSSGSPSTSAPTHAAA